MPPHSLVQMTTHLAVQLKQHDLSFLHTHVSHEHRKQEPPTFAVQPSLHLPQSSGQVSQVSASPPNCSAYLLG